MSHKSHNDESLRDLIVSQLSRSSQLLIDRDAFATAIVNRIQGWKQLDQDVATRQKTYKCTLALSQKLAREIDAVTSRLEKMGARIDPKTGKRISGLPIDAALLGACWRAADPLVAWQELYQLEKSSGRPRELPGTFAARLLSLFRGAGLSRFLIDDLFEALSGRHGLPSLKVSTVKQRRHRDRKRGFQQHKLVWDRLLVGLNERDARMRSAREAENRLRWGKRRELLPALPHYGDVLTPAVLFSMDTGLRHEEVATIRWQDVDFERKLLTVDASPHKPRQQFPLTPRSIEILQRWREHIPAVRQPAKIFPFDDDDLDTKWNALLEQIGSTHLQWEDLATYWYLVPDPV